MTDRDWTQLIDKKAAAREQFPPLHRVIRERPGTNTDRANREFWAADNRRDYHPVTPTEQERDADQFIRAMRDKQQAEFLARFEQKRNERKAS